MRAEERMLMNKWGMTITGFLLAAACAYGAASPAKAEIELAVKQKPGLVVVEYHLTYDSGQAPPRVLLPEILDCKKLIEEKRPLVRAGFLTGATRVVTAGLPLPERFIDSITVRFAAVSVTAHIDAWALERNAVFLSLDGPLSGAKPFTFKTSGEQPFSAADYVLDNGEWTVRVRPLSGMVMVPNGKTDRAAVRVPEQSLVVDARGQPVGLTMRSDLPADEDWKGPPDRWKKISAADLSHKIAAIRSIADANLLRVDLGFRSPKANTNELGGSWNRRNSGGIANISVTEAFLLGVRLDAERFFVIGDLPREFTARLERIKVLDGKGLAHTARFDGSLKDYGAFGARLDHPQDGSMQYDESGVLAQRNHLVLAAQVQRSGSERVCRMWPMFLSEFERGYKDRPAVRMPVDEEGIYLFTIDGALLAVPAKPRQQATMSREAAWEVVAAGASFAPAAPVDIAVVKAEMAAAIDSANAPVDEKGEGRLAWMGVVLQPLDRDLARVNGVSQQTDDGETGALVSYVYPRSPADGAGMRQGMVLLRVQIEGEPGPQAIETSRLSSRGGFWDDNSEDQSESSYGRMPAPWPEAEDDLSRLLTNAGFGRKYSAVFADSGRIITRDFIVTESPLHYESAPRYTSDSLGLTVRDFTYEVRRYYQKTETDPGIVVSKIEPGSKASVAGVRPYELITHVNGKPVMNIAEFMKLIRGVGEIQLTLNRMYRTRQVNIRMN
jgi:hypothetical protein